MFKLQTDQEPKLKKKKASRDSSSSNASDKSLNKVMESVGYKLGKTIGTGSYGSVRLALNLRSNNQLVACKIINKEKASPKFIEKFLPRELDILRKIKHPHIVKVFNIYGMGSKVFVFMHYCSQGDLLDYIRDHGPFPEGAAKVLFGQLLSAVQYLHSVYIAHRDLKCENILLVKSNYLMLTDFGFSRYFQPGDTNLSTTFCGSAAYAAPEIIEGVAYNPLQGDVWSLGCVLFIMLTGTMPFDDSNLLEVLRIQRNRLLEFPAATKKKLSELSRKLVYKCLEPIPSLRASLKQLQRDPWLRNLEAGDNYSI